LIGTFKRRFLSGPITEMFGLGEFHEQTIQRQH
jgi:hypothetical protein